MKRKLNIGILSQSTLFKKTLKAMLGNLNKLNSSDYLTVMELETDFRKLDVLIGDGKFKYVDEFTCTNSLHQINKDLTRVIISKEIIKNLPNRDICLVKPFRFLDMAKTLQKLYSEFSTGNNPMTESDFT